MRDYGFDFYWYDKYSENIFARGFEHKPGTRYEAVTTFESFEHFVNPLEELETMLSFSRSIIFTTELLPHPIPYPEEWWYYGLNHGQHISFYTEKTFQYIAQKYQLTYFNLNGLHIFSKNNIPRYAKYILKFSKFGLHNLLQRKLKSKTWDDYLQMSEKI
jgi:hypothetical protein